MIFLSYLLEKKTYFKKKRKMSITEFIAIILPISLIVYVVCKAINYKKIN